MQIIPLIIEKKTDNTNEEFDINEIDFDFIDCSKLEEHPLAKNIKRLRPIPPGLPYAEMRHFKPLGASKNVPKSHPQLSKTHFGVPKTPKIAS